ncbi:nucleotide-diphosphate-sugar epimerase/NmrA family protein [Amycolatopsis mediterranei S699]|uniref:Nucleotide-diphosphate-sugar epimerase/NmrA family protein n=1 Tax=Amycolatopsis mediterranei (strain U-32) TaxID=749927 RepID=A0A0H3D403_AMYMU|nr:NAD(P)H-binding protein [Amycolatopsis mediterranei]ADJ44956.1 nucleotide-diphosphate-sugar epimerase/NmrA family protein [Amycolatopsis mediterranei U32]AFO76667.1 nucleotide-diphosphate-sugar epimerase/NmrA family protein [Amycolatopsis mediterranei S699]AGT83795.1 nucleotide-diphosphate-sugar epimerase/NmrA family protein [Amycolatopsis mediterranei RB]KDO07218.1 nucleoside-diphosphate sugar epimerase [Amycolatopsis mediterranei]KDU91708.1 nucleoside-diphosphate sugar epimerase [Amycolat
MIVITAPTGQIGSKLVATLLRHDEPVRVVVRDPGRLPAEVRQRAEVVVGSHRDPDVLDRALDGAEALFWLMPAAPTASSPYEAYVTASIPGADAVVRHAVPRVVIVSALGRGSQIYAGHVSASHAMEDLFRSTGAHVRALALPTFMDNVLRQVASIREGEVSGTVPAGFRMPWIATKDIAALAAGYLRDRTWTGQDSVEVRGGEDLSHQEIADVLTDVLGTPVRFRRGDRAAVGPFLVGRGFSEAMARSVVDMDLAGERGINNATPRTPENTTPTTFREFAEEFVRPAVRATQE